MQVMYECCCGIDVHKKMVVACMNQGGKQELRQFDTMTDSLRVLCAWLQENQCQMVAMESTASYWKPLYNLFEVNGIEAMVVNAAHMKALPGRKTDMKDAAWISDLLRHGLLQASYIPDREQRELREAARYRKSLIEERARELNRLQKMLEGANIKLKSTLSNINGKSARGLIEQLIVGKPLSAEETAQFLQGSARKKLDEVMRAMDGVTTRMQRRLLGQVVDHIDDMTRRIEDMDGLIQEQMEQYEQAIRAIDEIPGIGRRSAETILSEIGLDMGRFPSAAHLCSWAGICPGNHESAGKRYSGRIRPGNQALKTILVECAKSASKVTRSFFSAQYHRIAARRGGNRATVAVAHSILIAIYHILKDGAAFKDLGSEYYTRFNRERKIERYLRKLNELGWSAPANASA